MNTTTHVQSFESNNFVRKIAIVLSVLVIGVLCITYVFSDNKADETTLDVPKSREEKIEAYFNVFNKSNYNVVNAVKESLDDPSSFKHVKTKYYDLEDTIRLRMKFQSKNAANTVITKQVWAELNPEDGKLIEWGYEQ